MQHEHWAGEKLFVDYAGQTVEVVDPETGEVSKAQIFVAVLGACSYTYAEATASQGLEDWIGSHVRAFSFLRQIQTEVDRGYTVSTTQSSKNTTLYLVFDLVRVTKKAAVLVKA